MTRDPGIVCFRHCCSQSIFCKNVPEVCPICETYIIGYNVEPFAIPYPYRNAAYEPTAIVVRPSQGNFLNDYSIASDLHIGITNSKGIAFEYDKQGLIVNDHSKWTNCIAINVVSSSWDSHWDETLEKMLNDSKWKCENYDEATMNCFNFVMEFVNNLQYLNMRFVNKENLCDELILLNIQDAIKYNSLFKKLESSEYFIS